MLLYGLYAVVSHKTVRRHENFYKRYKKLNDHPGQLIKTNRGWFIQDGSFSCQIDQKSKELWFELNKSSVKWSEQLPNPTSPSSE